MVRRATGRVFAATSLGLALTLSLGCGDPGAPTTGAIGVTVSTAGADIDPDGYVLWVDQRAFRVIGANAAATVADLAPGEHRVLLEGLALNCYVSSTNPRSVVVTAGRTVTAAFSISCVGPTQIAFVDVVDGNEDIVVISSNGTGLTRRTTHPASDSDPAWSPDGSRIAFTSMRDGNREIYVMNADGASQMRLTRVAGSDYRPAWSPDGGRIAFVSERDGNAEIYVMNADGTSPVRVTSHDSFDGEPAWSPDGNRIAFRSNRDGNGEIYAMNVDGSGLVRLTSNNVVKAQPAWSADGTRIAFTGNGDIFAMNADGSGLTRIVSGGEDPAWSADGRIAFAMNDCGFYSYGCFSDILIARQNTIPYFLTSKRLASNPAWRP